MHYRHCPQCHSSEYKKNGFRRGKQSYRCKNCGRQFIDEPVSNADPDSLRELCLKMYLNRLGFRAIARIMNICHSTIIEWVKKVVSNIPEQIMDEEIPEITEIDELQTFVASKKNKVWVWTVVNHWKKGILLWTIGERSHQTFEILWQIISCWHSFWYVTDGYKVYPGYIESEDHLVSKTYMTRVEGENSRLRDYLARLHRKTFCYSKSVEMLQYSIKLLIHYLKFETVPL